MSTTTGTMNPPRIGGSLDRVRTSAGILAAVAGAITGMLTIYEKVKTEARTYTAASYETLAPQLNQMNEALRQLEVENRQMRQALTTRATPIRVRTPTKAHAAPQPSPPPVPAAEQPQGKDRLDEFLGTVTRTREAVEAVRKVPESFKTVLEQRQK